MSSSAELLSLANGILGGNAAVQGIFHEVSVLTIFAMSFMLWHYAKTYHLCKTGKPTPRLPKVPVAEVTKEKDSDKSVSPQPGGSPKCPPKQDSALEAEQHMVVLLEQKEFTRALYMFKSLERSGGDKELKNEELFSSFVMSATRIGKFDVVDKMLRVMQRNSIKPSLGTWQNMLKLLSTKKRFSSCLLAYSLFEKTFPTDQVCYSCLVNAALDNGMPEEAAKVLTRYRSSDLNPKEWVLFFRTYGMLGDVEQAEMTFSEVGSDMTPLMLNLLLQTCVQEKQFDRAERCLQKAHDLEKGSSATIVNAVSYNTIIKGFTQAGQPERCLACFQGLCQHGIEPDETTVGMLVDACLKSDRHVGIVEALMTSLRQKGKATNTIMCTHFLKLLIKTSRLKEASQLYKDMKNCEDTQPDVVTCSMLIKAYVNANNLGSALRVLDDMLATGCKLDDRILTCLLDGCRNAGDHERGIDLFDQFVKMGVVPSDYSILSLLKLLGNACNHDAAHELVASCERRYGTKPSVIHYTCLMSAAIRSKSPQHAWQAYILMLQHGVQPDATSISTLLPGLVVAEQWDRVVELVCSALKDASPPLAVPVVMLNNALSQMIAGSGPEQHVLRMQLLMQGAGIPITARNASRMS